MSWRISRSLTAAMPMGFGDEWLRFNGIGENVTWGLYNNDAPSDAQKERHYEVLSWAAKRGLAATFHWHNERSRASPAGGSGTRERRDAAYAAALVDRALERRLAAKSRAHEGDGRRLADAERILLPGRSVPRPARAGSGAGRAADRERAAHGAEDRRRHRRAPRDVAVIRSSRCNGCSTARRSAACRPAGRRRRRRASRRCGSTAKAAPGSPSRTASVARSPRAGSPTSPCWTRTTSRCRVGEIGSIVSLLTMVGGRIVYGDGPFAAYEERAH